MSKETIKINTFFRDALKSDIESVRNSIALSERQESVFNMFYVRKNDIGFIADSLNVCVSVINEELKRIRKKIIRVL